MNTKITSFIGMAIMFNIVFQIHSMWIENDSQIVYLLCYTILRYTKYIMTILNIFLQFLVNKELDFNVYGLYSQKAYMEFYYCSIYSLVYSFYSLCDVIKPVFCSTGKLYWRNIFQNFHKYLNEALDMPEFF